MAKNALEDGQKHLPSLLREELYKRFPLDSCRHSGFCSFSDRNEENLSQELSIRENGKFVLWKNAFGGPLPDDNLVYVRMRSRAPLNPHFLIDQAHCRPASL